MIIIAIIFSIVLYHFYGLGVCAILFNTTKLVSKATGIEIVNPLWIKNNSRRLNWFGAVLVSICFTLLIPLPAVGYWIYKICTVGGDKNKES